jgi:CheY-like chemotaxis protein
MNLGGQHITGNVETRPRVRPGDCYDQASYDPVPVTRTGRPPATQGALTEASLHAEPASSPAALLPVGRRGTDPAPRTVTILLIDDDTVDVTAIRRSFWQLKIANPLIVARNGLEALDILRGNNNHEKLATPYLILLDLNMPRMGGIEFLDILRRDPGLRRSLVFVMTTSAADEDRERAYEKNIAGYVRKPIAGEGFTPAICALESYWRAIEFPD